MNCPRCGGLAYAEWIAKGRVVTYCIRCEEQKITEARDRIRDAIIDGAKDQQQRKGE